MRRALAAVALGLVVATAGCGGVVDSPFGSGTPSTLDPVGDFSYPPGVTDQGVTDPDALLAAHEDGLAGRSVEVRILFEVTANGSEQRVDFSGRVDPSTDRSLLHVSVAGGTADYYEEDGEVYVRQVFGNETRYRTGADVPGLTEKRLGSDRFVEAAVTTANFTPAGTLTRDGTRLLQLSVTRIDPEFGPAERNATRTVEGRLLVDEDGVVHLVTVHAVVETDAGARYEYAVEVDITGVGSTTVERPDWLDEARAGG